MIRALAHLARWTCAGVACGSLAHDPLTGSMGTVALIIFVDASIYLARRDA